MPIDYKKYPPNWRKEIVPRILRRADNKCEKCGLPNGDYVYSVPFNLSTAYKSGRPKYVRKRIWFSTYDDALREADCETDIKEVKVVLTVAHLDHDEENWDIQDDRLMAMCQKCHLKYDAHEKYLRRNGMK